MPGEYGVVQEAPPAPGAEAPGALGRRTTAGVLWLLLQSLSGRAAGFVSQLVLARLLLPEAFGQVGLAYTVTGLVGALISFGVDDVVLQRSARLQHWLAPAFWCSLGLSVVGTALLLAAAPLAAHIYGSPGLTGLIAVVALTLPLGALATVPTVKLRAAMDFRFIAAYSSLEIVGVQLASVLLAAAGFDAYSFVLPLPVAAAVKLVVFWRKAPTRITWRYRVAQLAHLLRSGLLILATRIINETVNQGDYIILGIMTTDAVVGVYFFAFRLAAQPLRMLAGNFGAVLFPALTQLGADPARQRSAALQAARILVYVVTPVCFLQAALAAPTLHLMFGTRWDGAIPLIQILSLGLPGDAVAWIGGALLVARKQFRLDLVYLLMFAPPFFALVFVGALLGSSLGVAVGASLYYALVKPVNAWLMFQPGMRRGDAVRLFVQPYLVAGLAIGACYAVAQLLVAPEHPLGQLLLIVGASPFAYAAALRLCVPDVLRELLQRFPVARLAGRAVRRLRMRPA